MPPRHRHSQKPPPAFQIVAKPRGALCNLACRYCFFLPKAQIYADDDSRMSDAVLESYTRQYIQAQHTPEVTFIWQGGEPLLMGLDFYARVLELQRRYAKPGQAIRNALQTNGTLLNDAWAKFFRQNHFLIGLSLDGPAAQHDSYRVDKGGQPSHAQTLYGLRILQDHKVEFNILCCVHQANMRFPLEVYRYFRDELAVRFIQFIPIVQRDHPTGWQQGTTLRPESVDPQQYGRFLVEVFDEWVRRDVGQVFVQTIDVALNAWVGLHAGLCVCEPTCGLAPALAHNGDLYACDHYVEPDYRLGNILEQPLSGLLSAQRQTQFGQAKQDTLPRYCRACPVLFACQGGCPKDRVSLTPEGEPGLNYLCAGYRDFFTNIDAPMKMMAELLRRQRSPAEVMRWLAAPP